MAPRNPNAETWQFFYASRVTEPLEATPEVVLRIVEQLRAYNARRDMTGAIACDGDFFVHVVEGSERNVSTLLRMISKDPRQGDMRILLRTPIQTRYFGEWSLAYVPDAPLGERVRDFFGPGANDVGAVRQYVRDLYSYISRVA